MRTRPETLKKRTDPEYFRKLRSLSPDSPEWEELRDLIFEENQGLAYHAVDDAGWWFLNTFSGEMRDQMRADLLQVACRELDRVIRAYDPDRPNPHDPSKPVEFSTFALSNLPRKVRTYCLRENKHHFNVAPPPAADDDEDGEFSLDDFPGPDSNEAVEIDREERLVDLLKDSDPALAERLRGILNSLRGGDGVTIFERQLLFRLIADPALILTRVERDEAAHSAALEAYEPLPLRRHRWWRQMLK